MPRCKPGYELIDCNCISIIPFFLSFLRCLAPSSRAAMKMSAGVDLQSVLSNCAVTFCVLFQPEEFTKIKFKSTILKTK